MSLKDTIQNEYKTALKSKDKNKISTYRLILSSIKDLDIINRSGPNKKDTDDEDIKKLLKKMVKQRAESIDIYKKNNRTDLLEVEQNEHDILTNFLPKQLGEEETKKIWGDVIAKLKNRNITTPFDGIIGKRDFSNDIDVSQSSIILNLEDTSVLFVDVDIPETFAPYVKKGQTVDIKFSGNVLKRYSGTVESTASRIDTNKRSLPVRIKLNNPNNELLSGSLLEISINYNERNSLSILDTSLIMEGDNVYVYKVDKENTVKKVPVEIGLRKKGIVEITSGLEDGDTVVAEGLKKTRPNGKIKPIKYGSKQTSSGWGKKKKSTKEENKK